MDKVASTQDILRFQKSTSGSSASEKVSFSAFDVDVPLFMDIPPLVDHVEIESLYKLKNPGMIKKFLEFRPDIQSALLAIWRLLKDDFSLSAKLPRLVWDGDYGPDGNLYVVLPVVNSGEEALDLISQFEHNWLYNQPEIIRQSITLTI